MSSLEQFVNTIRNFYQQSNIPFQEIYNTLIQQSEFLLKNVNSLENILPIFQLPEYTLPHLSIIHTLIIQQPSDRLLNNIEICIKNSNNLQIQQGAELYSEICHYYTNRLCELNEPKKGLLTIYNALKQIQKTQNQLTSLHSDLLQLCLASKNFRLALDVLNNDILDINRENGSYDSKPLLSFFYYTGCIYAALKDYDKSLFYFEQAITIPCTAVSQIMIESYKKFILISLILKGKLIMLPKYTSRLVINQIKPLCSAYHELANSFINFDLEKLNIFIQKYHDLYQQDHNMGLVKQLKQSLFKKNIQKLTKTYITLSLNDMAVKVKLLNSKDAEYYVLNMIKDNEIYATINQKANMVSFHDNPQKYDCVDMTDKLNSDMLNVMNYDRKVKELDKEITVHPHYIQKCMSSSATAGLDDSDPIK
jgi:COP9 signalosome complex subunit 3